MTIIITGISGFLGSHLANYLLKKHTIIGIRGKRTPLFPVNNIQLYDIYNFEDIKQVPDVIIMCHAAVASGKMEQDSDTLYNANIDFTNKILNKFPHIKCVFISSVSVYEKSETLLTETSVAMASTSYGHSKLSAEKIVLESGKNTCVIRFPSLYGIGMKENTIIPMYVNQALSDRVIDVWGKGDRKQNYLNVFDAVMLIAKVIEQPTFNRGVFLGTFVREYSNLEIAKIIASKTSAKINFTGSDIAFSVAYNNLKTQTEFNWEPVKDIKEGLSEYIEWKQKQF